MLKEQLTNTTEISREKQIEILRESGFVFVPAGKILLGTDKAVVCRLEGRRWNETPVREIEVEAFWVAPTKVTNALYELHDKRHKRPLEGQGDTMPVSDITYREAVDYCQKINKETGMNFRLPTEPEWIMAAAPYGWEFSYQERADHPDKTKTHVHDDGTNQYIVEVDDARWQPNFRGLHQIDHNVMEMTQPFYRTEVGHWGSQDDGAYFIAKGGNYGHCAFTPGVQRRALVDVADRNPRIGFRLFHTNPYNNV